MGSGTFLIEGAGRLQAGGIDRFWERLTGFDISAQAICIAQVNLYVAVLAHLDRQEAEAVGTLRLYPTDALDPRNGTKLRGIMPLLTDATTRAFLLQRIELSEAVKQQAHFPLVIGNPPYRNNSEQTLAQVAARFPRLLRSSRDNARARKRNIRDDYAWFFAAADHYVADRGIIAFVVSDSFCYASSYRFFREDLLRRYRVRHLLNLGALIFRDVGPRTQFAIIVLERRNVDLTRADDCEPIQYVDLRPLGTGSSGTAPDPRLAALEANALPPPQEHLPVRERSFTLYPAIGVVTRVETIPVVLHGDRARRVFIKKWPGLITAFDELFKGSTREELTEKIIRFFAASELSETEREASLDELAPLIRAVSAKNCGRLSMMARQASEAGLRFDELKVRRAVSGSAPNDAAWYPDERQTMWIYYEPRLAVPRNVNEGRNPGWGTMSQWRDPDSHGISPKLVFTTSTNPDAGLKAFVLPGNWIVKLHGGESQQFHYTGIDRPSAGPSFRGPNNLGDEALVFYLDLVRRGHDSEALLFYIAGIYNSQIAEDYLAGGGGNIMHIPVDPTRLNPALVDRIIATSRELRNLHWVAAEARGKPMSAELAERLISAVKLRELEFEELPGAGGRFLQRRSWRATLATIGHLNAEIAHLRETLDNDVNDVYPR